MSTSLVAPATSASIGLVLRAPALPAAVGKPMVYASSGGNTCGTFSNSYNSVGDTPPAPLVATLTDIANKGPNSIPSSGVPGGTGGCFFASNEDVSRAVQSNPSLLTVRPNAVKLIVVILKATRTIRCLSY